MCGKDYAGRRNNRITDKEVLAQTILEFNIIQEAVRGAYLEDELISCTTT